GRWRATYTGRGAHAAANPTEGINANDAAVVAQVAAGLLRQRMHDGQRLALVPQQSGVTNIVPEIAIIDLECRALTMPAFEELRRQVFASLEAGAVATGAALEITTTEPIYEPLLQDELLGAAWNAAMRQLGRPLERSLGIMAASTDMGNVSQRLPSLHPFVAITGAGGAPPTRELRGGLPAGGRRGGRPGRGDPRHRRRARLPGRAPRPRGTARRAVAGGVGTALTGGIASTGLRRALLVRAPSRRHPGVI